MGWRGRTAAAVLLLGLGFGGFVWWAMSNNSVASLDRVDSLFARERTAKLAVTGRYGDHPAQKFELFVPEGRKPARGVPLIAFYHGGGWRSGDPQDYRFIARTLSDRGYATALIGYRLVPAGRFPNMLLDSAAGLAAVRAVAAEHGVDPERIALMGHSAGAYNVTMLTLDRRWLAGAGVAEAAIKGTIVLAGPSDFYPFEKTSSRNAMGHWPRPEETQPVTYARADAPPLLLVHGTEDDSVRPRNARILARTMTERGAPTQATLIEGMGHNGLVITLARPFDRDRRVGDAVFGFLKRVLAPGTERAVAASSPVQPARP
ncbi:MAG: alpha/beta hydrolase [Novosphingobium sp.]|nr:alpha/beta hydrolase [Novosphingobium sp.]